MHICSNIMYIYSFFSHVSSCLRAWCPLYTKIKRFRRVLLFGCVTIHQVMQTSICVRTQIAKTAHLPAEYILPTFLTRTPSPYSAGWRWGLLSRKIFSDFYFSFLLFDFYSYFIFLFFQISSLYSSDFDFPIIGS